ncbi:MAG TPA: MFS transporter [Solirubrobacteraceae bacterium]|jgi:DHA2 family methylenomycin A resistance protein-like MFS transporter|nr:MFS transporter [Solirubrobacteraceae bacterium]
MAIVASLGFFIVALDTTVVNVALAHINHDFHTGVSGLQWVVDGYTVAFASLLLSAGALSDRVGAHHAFRWGLGGFVLASAACGLAPNIGVLIGARVVQGLAGAVVQPSSLALASTAFSDPSRQRQGISIWTSAGAAAITAGPVLGGLFTDWLGWRSVFYINLPIGIFGVIAATRVFRRAPARPAHLDLPGQILAAVTLFALTFGVIEGGHDGFGRPYVIAALAVAVIAGVAFVLVELRETEPLLPMRLFHTRAAETAIGVSMVLFLVFYGQVFTLSLFFQNVLGHSPAVTGLLFLPMTLLTTVGTFIASRMVARFGTWVPLVFGLEILAAAFLAFATVDRHTSTLLISLALVPAGLGIAIGGPPLPMAMIATLPAERAGIASGVFNATRQVGATLGVAIFGALVSSSFTRGMHIALYGSVVVLVLSIVAALRWIRAPG